MYQRGTKANGHKYFASASIRVWFSGRMIGSGAKSMVTDRLGSVVKSGTESLSYYPYGEQRTGNANADREKFATYSRDAVSGLDYAQNRYYSSQFGRFTTADPYTMNGGSQNPQVWNRYSYVEDDPANLLDPKGLYSCGPEGCGDEPGCDDLRTKKAPGTGPCVTAWARRPAPSYLKVAYDCYVEGSIEGKHAERHIQYELYGDNDARLKAAIITEHVSGVLPITGETQAGLVGGIYQDTIAILNTDAHQHVTQIFTATTVNYSTPEYTDVPLFVRAFGGGM